MFACQGGRVTGLRAAGAAAAAAGTVVVGGTATGAAGDWGLRSDTDKQVYIIHHTSGKIQLQNVCDENETQ